MLHLLLIAELGTFLEHEGQVLEVLDQHGNALLVEGCHFTSCD